MPRKRVRNGGLIGVLGAISSTGPPVKYLTNEQIREGVKPPNKPHSEICSWCDGKKSGYVPFFCRKCGNELFKDINPKDQDWYYTYRAWVRREIALNRKRSISE